MARVRRTIEKLLHELLYRESSYYCEKKIVRRASGA